MRRKRLIIRAAEFLVGQKIAIVYCRLYDYKKSTNTDTNCMCPFCRADYKTSFNDWHIRDNIFPYPRTQTHMMVCPNTHTTKRRNVGDTEKIEFYDIIASFMDQGHFVVMRQYPHEGASVQHIHAHIIKSQK